MDVRLREHTMYTKRYIIDLKIRPYFEKKILSEITVADVRAWQNELLMYKGKMFLVTRNIFTHRDLLLLLSEGLHEHSTNI